MADALKKPCRKCLLRDMGGAEYLDKLDSYIERIPAGERTPAEEYERRLSLCRKCGRLQDGTCSLCGCYVEARAAVRRSPCPDVPDRWAVAAADSGSDREREDKVIYLDNAATTRMSHEVFEAMKPYFEEEYANVSSLYRFAAKATKAVNRAREAAAALLGASPGEIYFTGGGSESDNWALTAAAFARRQRGNHIITTRIEHHAVLRTCEFLAKQGFDITYLDVDGDGMIKLDELKAAIRPTTILISVMFANNEIGTLEPIREIGEIAGERGILFHTDAVQAYGHIPIDVEALHIDMLSASGHKLNGPKGVGILYLRDTVQIGSFIHGGGQEKGLRAGTLNTPGIVGFGRAAELAAVGMEERAAYERGLRDRLVHRVLSEIPCVRLTGHREKRLPNSASFSFGFVEGEALLIMLDQNGICASSGSACASGSGEPSHVLTAIGLSDRFINGGLRLTLSGETTEEEIDFVADRLKEIVEKLRSMSPQYKNYLVKERVL